MPDSRELIIEYNQPTYIALEDPNGIIDQQNQGHYRTTAGQNLTLPRQAVYCLNMCGPRPGEEIRITKHWEGKKGDPVKWQIALSGRKELAPLEGPEPATMPESSAAPTNTPEPERKPIQAPTPIRRSTPPAQPRLFDGRGTGTYGPSGIVKTALNLHTAMQPRKIAANVAIKEILEFINADPNTANWSAEAKEQLAETIFKGTAAAGHIGLWERGE